MMSMYGNGPTAAKVANLNAHTAGSIAWNEGQPETACPYKPGRHAQYWLNGWHHAADAAELANVEARAATAKR